MRPIPDSAGFTLIEMIVVIAITAIIGSMVAVFMRGPIEGYVALDRRAALADAADTALRRMSRDVHLALPNSVRVQNVGTTYYLEFLETRTGGRYRAQGGGDILDFTTTDSSFDVIGPGVDMRTGDRIAIYNLGITGADAWAGDTLASYSGGDATATTNIGFTPKQFPLASPGNRFQVVDGAVTYVCNPTAGTLTRYWNYAISPGQPTAFPPGTSQALLATHVSDCTFTYHAGATERGGLASVTLTLTRDGEHARLYASMHVSNHP